MPSFEDHEHYKTWLRFKEAAGEEKQWMHQRLGWMIAAQAALFAIYGLKPEVLNLDMQVAKEIKAAIPIAGYIVSLIGFLGTLAAAQMHWLWTSNLNAIVDYLTGCTCRDQTDESKDSRLSLKSCSCDVKNVGVLSFGSRPRWAARSSSILPPLQAYFFVCIWGFIAIKGTERGIQPIYFGIVALLLLIVIGSILVLVTKKKQWKHQTDTNWPNEQERTK